MQNRRVLCIKEVEILGHMSIDWQYPFEDFVQSPTVDGNLLKISVEVRKHESHTFRVKTLLNEWKPGVLSDSCFTVDCIKYLKDYYYCEK